MNDVVILNTTFIQRWMERMCSVLKSVYPSASKKTITKYLEKTVLKQCKNRNTVIINNYTNQLIKTDLLQLFDYIERKQFIIGGDGVLYLQHAEKDNPQCGYIEYVKAMRKLTKDERKRFIELSYEWFMKDIAQGNFKKKINSLYGVLGYIKFILSNRFIAQSVTNQGRQIISSATCCFENFLSDNLKFVTFAEMLEYIQNIRNEYNEKYSGKDENYGRLDVSNFRFKGDPVIIVKERLMKKCGFQITEIEVDALESILNSCSSEELVLIYYKNNLHEFNKLPFISAKLDYLLSEIDSLNSPDHIAKLPENLSQCVENILQFYQVFVMYSFPVYDRVRKTMFTDKKSVIYIDTDSNFLALSPLVKSTKSLLSATTIQEHDSRQLRRNIVNLFTYFCQKIVNIALHNLAISMHIKGEWEHIFSMKNEYYDERIVFTIGKKKRYLALQVIQEGKELNEGKGQIEIKGFDFKKATTKEFVRDYFTRLSIDMILRAKEIDVSKIYKELLRFRKEMETDIKNGETRYYKQSDVKEITNYKKPWSTQGITSIHLWNVLCPDYAIELPADVNIVPIKDMTAKKRKVKTVVIVNGQEEIQYNEVVDFSSNKTLNWLKTSYPEYYDRIERGIINNENDEIRKMGMKFIATPKNPEIPLPPFFSELIDTERIVSSTIELYLPIMESLGLRPQKVNATTQYLSNIVKL